MSQYAATVWWERDGAKFTDNRYSRGHAWTFDGGVEVPASSSPHAVPVPLSVEAAVDPEEAFVASVASCHMLWFLSIAARRGFVVDSYRDDAVGTLAKNSTGKMAMTEVTLRPDVSFAGDRIPTAEESTAMHDEAHHSCYIASSIRSEVRCQPAERIVAERSGG